MLKLSDKETHAYYAFVCVTSPILGSYLSGLFSSKILRGYTNIYALPCCFIAGLVAVVTALPFPYTKDPYFAIFLLWMLLFAGSFLLPILVGIMLNSVEPDLRPPANSIANFAYNLLGYLPSPAVYGYVCEITGGRESREGMKVLMGMSVIAVIFMTLAILSDNRYYSLIFKSKNKDEI